MSIWTINKNNSSEGALPPEAYHALMLGSVVCRQEHFTSDWYRRWSQILAMPLDASEPRSFDRKPWEFAAVAQTLEERGMLRAGMRGLGFAVGTEPLPSLFATYGVDVVATDLDTSSGKTKVWSRSNQHSITREGLFRAGLVERDAFERHVSYEFADMNGTWPWEEGTFDFIWSCCSFEHTGSLERGMRFVLRSSRLLKPGGIAAHTTEFNCSSNDKTVSRGPGVLYRQRDVEELDRRLRKEKRCLARMDFFAGDGPHDRNYDSPPYHKAGQPHVKLEIDGYVCTSMLVTVLN